MLNVHLFFIKMFGGLILEGSAPLSIQPFANAIVTGQSHSQVYLKFGCGVTLDNNPVLNRTGLQTKVRSSATHERCTSAAWSYNVNGVSVTVMYSEQGMQSGMKWWHPRLTTDRVELVGIGE